MIRVTMELRVLLAFLRAKPCCFGSDVDNDFGT